MTENKQSLKIDKQKFKKLLFVSSNLACFEKTTDFSTIIEEIKIQLGTGCRVYRPLVPMFYAWLRSKTSTVLSGALQFEVLKSLSKADREKKRLSHENMKYSLREKFNIINQWIKNNLSETDLEEYNLAAGDFEAISNFEAFKSFEYNKHFTDVGNQWFNPPWQKVGGRPDGVDNKDWVAYKAMYYFSGQNERDAKESKILEKEYYPENFLKAKVKPENKRLQASIREMKRVTK